MGLCKKCGEYRLNEGDCPCEAFTIIDENGEEHKIFAIAEYSAALKYAEVANTCGDYYLMNESVEIKVNGKSFEISAEPDIYYSADEI